MGGLSRASIWSNLQTIAPRCDYRANNFCGHIIGTKLTRWCQRPWIRNAGGFGGQKIWDRGRVASVICTHPGGVDTISSVMEKPLKWGLASNVVRKVVKALQKPNLTIAATSLTEASSPQKVHKSVNQFCCKCLISSRFLFKQQPKPCASILQNCYRESRKVTFLLLIT